MYDLKGYRKKYTDWHRAAGLCVACPGKASPGLTRCLQCRRLRMKEFVPCRYCGANLPIPRRAPYRYHDRCRVKAIRHRARVIWNSAERTPAYIAGHRRAALGYQRRHRRQR